MAVTSSLTFPQQLLRESDPYTVWLKEFCSLVPGASSGLVVTCGSDGVRPLALWPLSESSPLAELVQAVAEQRSALVTDLTLEGGEAGYGLAYPLLEEGELVLIASLALKSANEQSLKQAMRLLQWGCQGIRAQMLQRELQSQTLQERQLSQTLTLYSQLLQEQSFDSAALRLVTDLAVTFGCDLVSLGVIEKGAITVRHLSSSAQFGKQMNIVRHLEAAMNESTDQLQTVLYPLPSEDDERHQERRQTIVLAHQALADSQKDEAILTLPLIVGDRCFGAVTLQRPLDQPFTHQEADFCETLLGLAAACLEDKRELSKPLHKKIGSALLNHLGNYLGHGHVAQKLTAIGAVLVIAFLSLAQGDYRLSADARLKSAEQRVIVAPYDGYIDQAPVKAGHQVKQGDLLLGLDEQDMQLERLRWISQKNKLARQYQEASAEYDRAKVNIINAQIEQAEAQLKLVESRLQRARQLAPFDGLIVTGDLTQRLGGSVKQGELLYELAPTDNYKVALLVKESRILDLELGQAGTLYLSALPDKGFKFEIQRITPTTESRDGGTFYLVEGNLLTTSEALRPGMEGVGKVSIDRRNLFGIWTRDLREWLLLRQWAFWG